MLAYGVIFPIGMVLGVSDHTPTHDNTLTSL